MNQLPEPAPRTRDTASGSAAYPDALRRVVVIGAGVMGVQIAERLQGAGAAVTVVESSDARRQDLAAQFDAAGIASAASADDVGAADLVVEAVPERLELKQQVLQHAEQVLEPTVLASNTSSIRIAAMQQVLRQPGRFLGLHFFQPLETTKLVEIVRAEATEATTLELSTQLVRALGSYPLIAQDLPGFATSRLAVAAGLEAMRMVEDGVASVADIDEGMRRGYGHPEGPLAMTDIVGLDTRLGIARVLEEQFGARFAPPQLLIDLVEAGRLGRKSGQGFYDWNESGR